MQILFFVVVLSCLNPDKKKNHSQTTEIIDQLIIYPVQIFYSPQQTLQLQSQLLRQLLLIIQLDQNVLSLLVFKLNTMTTQIADRLYPDSFCLQIFITKLNNQQLKLLYFPPQAGHSIPSAIQRFQFLSQKSFSVLQFINFQQIILRNLIAVLAASKRLHEMNGGLMRMIWMFSHLN